MSIAKDAQVSAIMAKSNIRRSPLRTETGSLFRSA
jgi:hypothetical protein